MSDKPKSKFKWIEKLKNVKHIEIYITLIFAIVLILIFFSSTSGSKSSSISYSKANTNQQTTVSGYVDEMETKLEQILSKVQGASNVNVMITLDMSNLSIKDNVVQTTSFPSVKGVIVVAGGVQDTFVKMNILKAVQTVIDISSGSIEILASN